MKVLLTGSNGQLGGAIKSYKPNGINLIETNRKILDLAIEEDCKESKNQSNKSHLKISALPLEITLNEPCIKQLMHFFKNNHSQIQEQEYVPPPKLDEMSASSTTDDGTLTSRDSSESLSVSKKKELRSSTS